MIGKFLVLERILLNTETKSGTIGIMRVQDLLDGIFMMKHGLIYMDHLKQKKNVKSNSTNMQNNFDIAYAFTKKWEGGYVWDPADPGGETNLGITDRRDGKVDGKVDVDKDGTGDVPVKELTEDDAKTIYRRDYWDVLGCDNRKLDMAIVVFDTAVNCGVARTAIWLDSAHDPETLLEQRRSHYKSLVKRNHKLNKFLKGWMNRVDALHNYIISLEKKG